MALKNNVIVNYLGQGWVALMGIVFIPLYIKYLGMEAFGLIGIYVILQAWLVLLDMGMAATANREVARFSVGKHTAESIRDLLRSLELIYLALGIGVCGFIWMCAPWLTSNWLTAQELPLDVISFSLGIMGVAVVFRWWSGLYRGVLLGLQQQVLVNVVLSTFATLRFGGVVLVIAFVSPTVEAFFLWQAGVAIVECIILGMCAWTAVPKFSRRARFSVVEIKEIWRFAAGMLLTTALGLMLTQVDKLFLAKMLTLNDFGNFTLAAMLAGGLSLLVSPIVTAYYPRFSQLHALGDEVSLAAAYHRATQLVVVVVGSVAIVMFWYTNSILVLFTGDVLLAAKVYPILALLSLGTMLNGVMQVPYMLQLASGWSSFSVWVNFVALCFFIPVLLVVIPEYGATGSAATWLGLNLGYILFSIYFMHRRLLISEKLTWYRDDVFVPLTVVFLVCWLLGYLFGFEVRGVGGAVFLVMVWIVAAAAAFGVSNKLRVLIHVPKFK